VWTAVAKSPVLLVAAVPRPRLVLAPAAVDAPVPPSAIAKSVMPVMLPPVAVIVVNAPLEGVTEPIGLGAERSCPAVIFFVVPLAA